MGGNSAAVSTLLHVGVAANARTQWESTPLMLAARAPPARAAAVGRVLLAAGSDWSLKDRLGRTALDVATSKGSRELAELLCGFEGQEFFGFTPALRARKRFPPFWERWDTVRFIASGGFGDVHEVVTDKGIRCAAKTLRLPFQQLSDQLASDLEKSVEGERNLCELQHPNIIRFVHIQAQLDIATMTVFMELLDGSTLEIFIDRRPQEEGTIREFSEQICSALLYLHSQEPPVIHRDINCSNIIVLTDSRRIKLIDFGLSIKLEQSVSHLTGSSMTPRGTLNFMAPELLGAGDSDSVQYSRESDIWAFGCAVFQMASSARPFANCSNPVQSGLLLERKGAPALPDGWSAELKDFYKRCTAKGCKKRKSALELMEHEFLTGGTLKRKSFFNRK